MHQMISSSSKNLSNKFRFLIVSEHMFHDTSRVVYVPASTHKFSPNHKLFMTFSMLCKKFLTDSSVSTVSNSVHRGKSYTHSGVYILIFGSIYSKKMSSQSESNNNDYFTSVNCSAIVSIVYFLYIDRFLMKSKTLQSRKRM